MPLLSSPLEQSVEDPSPPPPPPRPTPQPPPKPLPFTHTRGSVESSFLAKVSIMDRSPKLSGETLIVHHIPLVHCQVSGGRQAGSGGLLKRSNPFSSSENLGLSRTTSLPERDVLQKEGLLYGSLIHTSSRSQAREARGDRGGDSSTNSQDHLVIAHTLPRAKTCNRNPLRHNPFLLNTEHCEDDEEEDEDGDNLYGYLEDSSFHLHGRPSSALEEEVVPFRLHDLDLGSEPFVLRSTLGKKWGSIGEESQESLRGVASELSNHLDDLRQLGLAGQRRHGSSGSNMSMDCVEQDWAEEDEDDEDQHMGCERSSKTVSSCNSHDYQEHFLHSFPEPFSEGGQQCYGSDSSCNSSDGVLVNFSAIYNKMSKPTNLNYSKDPSSTSSISPGSQRNPTGGAFYLDLHTSPTEPLQSHQQNSFLGQPFFEVHKLHPSTSSTRSSSTQEGHDLDANCNSYHPLHSGSSGDLTSCLQSQARLVVATQNYYKLVTCDLSSQSSPSPVGSSPTSCSEEPSKGSPTPNHPREYYLFKPGEDTRTASPGPNEDEEKNEDDPNQQQEECVASGIQGQVYVNSINGKASRPRSRSYDRNLDQAPPPRLGSLERMLSCPVRLSDTAAQLLSPPPRVTSFAEIARSKRRSGGGVSSPTLKGGTEALFSRCPYASLDAFPLSEQQAQGGNPGPSPLAGCCSLGSLEPCMLSGMEAHAQGSLCISKDGSMEMVRYSKDQRPTTLPIQPFSFQHPLGARPPQPKPLRPLLAGMVSGVGASGAQVRGTAGSLGGEESENSSENMVGHQGSRQGPAGGPPPGSIRPSPLGSYSPVRHQGAVSSGTCSTCTPSPQSACSRSCSLSSGLGPLHTLPSDPFRQAPPPDLLGQNGGSIPPTLSPVQGHCYHRGAPNMPRDGLCSLGSVASLDSSRPPDGANGSGCRPYNAHHLSPQALKWREYRRRNPLGVERSPDSASGGKAPRHFRRNVFDFPSAPSDHAPSSHAPRHHGGHSYSELLLDYFSLTEKPPEEFCLSPDPSSSKVSVDLPHKKGLVKAVNTAVDLVVAHFGTSRDPDVKAKLGNSWVSPNVGHLILKYLCPALREVLQDGLKAHLLDLIVGQRRCQPWSLVEASTQLGPSTRLLYTLFSKVSQFSELTSHSMRLNAFIFGLLNLRSLEFWFNHVYTHEDIVAAHYDQRGFLALSQGPCRVLFEELLLLLQPLSLLPFDLDVLFESHLLQKDQEHLLRKLQLCSVDQSTRSTFQLMRGWGAAVTQSLKEGGEAKKERAGLRREGTWPRMEGTGGSRDGGNNVVATTAIVSRQTMVDLWPKRGMSGQRMKGVGEESHGEDGERDRIKERERDLDRQAGWWYQLMQSSQVYIDQSAEGSKFIKSEKKRKSSERRQPPPTREGVIEGAESKQEAEEHVGKRNLKASTAEARSRPSWMGSPPESVLSQEKETIATQAAGPGAEAQSAAIPAESPLWGRLFGSTLGSPSRKEGAQQRPKKSRPPSGWLGLDRSVLDLMTLTIGSGTGKKGSPPLPNQSKALNPTSVSNQLSPCEVRALCHHIATEPGHLSFHKGDILKVLNKANPDWLLCSLGCSQGLVPIVYITLEHTEN